MSPCEGSSVFGRAFPAKLGSEIHKCARMEQFFSEFQTLHSSVALVLEAINGIFILAETSAEAWTIEVWVCLFAFDFLIF